MLDLAVALILGLAIFWGLKRGLIAPLLGELGFVVALLLTIRFHGLADSLLSGVPEALVTPIMVILLSIAFGFATRPLVAVLRRLPFVGPIDRFGGAAFNGLVTVVLMYLALGAVLDFDRIAYPTLRNGVVTVQQIETYRRAVAADPIAGRYTSDAQLRQAEELARQHELPVSAFQQLEQFLDFYVHDVRDPLLGSRLMPIINEVGGRLPLIGHPRPYLRPLPR